MLAFQHPNNNYVIMELLKSLHASLLTNTYRWKNKNYFTVGVTWAFDLLTGQAVLEQEMWATILKSIPKGQLFDEGHAKLHPEFFVYFDEQTQRKQSNVSANISVAGLHKEITFNDDSNGQYVPIDDPARAKFGGDYISDNYIVNHLGQLPPDIDFRFFNTAPKDQWFAKRAVLAGQTYSLKHAHPDHPLIQGHLPNIQALTLLETDTEKYEGKKHHFLNLRTDTIYFFPSALLGVLVQRASIEVKQPYAKDIVRLLLAHKYPNESDKNRDFYIQQLHERTGEKNLGSITNTKQLLPQGVQCGFDSFQNDVSTRNSEDVLTDINQRMDDELSKVIGEIELKINDLENSGQTEQSKELKILLETYEKTSKQTSDSQEIKKLITDIEQQIKTGAIQDATGMPESEHDKPERIAAIEISLAIASIQSQQDLSEQQKQQIIDALNDMQYAYQFPFLPRLASSELSPVWTLSDEKEKLLDILHKSSLDTSNQRELEDVLNKLEDMGPLNLEPSETSFQAYIDTVHNIEKAKAHQSNESVVKISELIDSVQMPIDLAFLNILDFNLSEREIRYLFAEFSSWKGIKLENSMMVHSIICRSTFEACTFNNTKLLNSNFGFSQFKNTQFINADFSGSNLQNCIFENCSFVACIFPSQSADILNVVFLECHFERLLLDELEFIESTLSRCKFVDSKLNNCSFIDSEVNQLNISNSTFDTVNFIRSNLCGLTVGNSYLKSVRIFETQEKMQFNFQNVHCEGVYFAHLNLANSYFDRVSMLKSELSSSCLDVAKIQYCDFSDSNLSNICARDTDFSYSNFFQVNFMQALLSGAGFEGANLAFANFEHSVLGDNSFVGANLDNTLIKDWRP